MRSQKTTYFIMLLSFALGCFVCALIPTNVTSAPPEQTRLVNTNVIEKLTGDCPQWGGDSMRNNVAEATNLPSEWEAGGFDRKTGQWQKEDAQHVLWTAAVGSPTYGNPVVAGGRVFVGTTNTRGYLPRYPGKVDLGCMIALSEKDGSFLWQHSNEKLPSTQDNIRDWPQCGVCCAPLVEGDRMWYVTNRGTIACLDTEGFYDGEDDGPEKAGLAKLFNQPATLHAGLDDGELPNALAALIGDLGTRFRVKKEEEGKSWIISVRQGREYQYYGVALNDGNITVTNRGLAKKPADTGEEMVSAPTELTAGLADGKVSLGLRRLLAKRGFELPENVNVASNGQKEWTITGKVAGADRKMILREEDSMLVAFKQLTTDDTGEADTVWTFDMMGELKTSQHNMCACSVTGLGDILFANTSNGVDESQEHIPNVDAPSFIALDKNTGKVLWTDNSPGANILHGQWSSPAAGVLGGVPQVIFAGGDGWVYSFKADKGNNGKPELLWKFDANPKDTEWVEGGRGTRNNIIATPVIYNGHVFVAVGQDPEHGTGQGHLWCIDPTKRGDVSPKKVVQGSDRSKVVPHRRYLAYDKEKGDALIDNENSAAIWHYTGFDQNNDGELEMHERMNRSCGTVAIKDDVAFIADFSGIVHCLDAATGKVYWTFDMLSAAWGTPLIADGKVFVGDEDGEVSVFKFSKNPDDAEPLAEVDMLSSVLSTPIVANNVMFIANKSHIFAIKKQEE
ncbi:MAG: PQQ-binding-like beta-propeller repeat protein [Planctomycetota bacterium]